MKPYYLTSHRGFQGGVSPSSGFSAGIAIASSRRFYRRSYDAVFPVKPYTTVVRRRATGFRSSLPARCSSAP